MAAERILLLTIFLICPFLSGGVASFNPATGEEEIVLVPVEKERNMGRNIDKKVKKHYSLPADPLMQERVEKIGERLSVVTDRRDMIYRFTVLNDDEEENYNAFAAPGGYVYIFEDLVELLETDDNIAAVLAHEMGHVEARHSMKRLQGNIGVTALMLAGGQMHKEEGTYAAASKAIGQLISAYSRQDEKQADELSVKYLERAGFDPNGAIGALVKLKELRKKGKIMKYSAYKSHPYLSSRLAYLNKSTKGYTDFDSYINQAPGTDGTQ
ncbi:MAG: M48 family metalloprotease [Candidatus Omnitrophota bacterium]